MYGSLELYIWTQNDYVEDNDASNQANCLVFHHVIAHICLIHAIPIIAIDMKVPLESNSQIFYIFCINCACWEKWN